MTCSWIKHIVKYCFSLETKGAIRRLRKCLLTEIFASRKSIIKILYRKIENVPRQVCYNSCSFILDFLRSANSGFIAAAPDGAAVTQMGLR